MNFNEADVVRDSAGKFGEHHRSAPDIDLDVSYTHGDPVQATLVKERWYGDDAQEIDREDVDVRALLDTYPLDGLPHPSDLGYDDNDFLFYEAQEHGLMEHDGPFTLSLPDDEYTEYYELRVSTGQSASVTEHFVDSPERVTARIDAVRAEIAALTERENRLLADLSHSEAHAEAPDSPSALSASQYGSVAEAAGAGERAGYAGQTAAPETDDSNEADAYMAAYDSATEGTA